MKLIFIMLSVILSPLVLLCGIVSILIIFGILGCIVNKIKDKEEK